MNRNLALKLWAGCGLAYGAQLLALPDFLGDRFFGKALNEAQRFYSRAAGIAILGFTATVYAIAEHGNQEIQNISGKIGAFYMAAIGANTLYHKGTILDSAVNEGVVVGASFAALLGYYFFAKK